MSSATRMEQKLLRGAACVTIVSPAWGEDLQARYRPGSKLHVVSNGCDSEALGAITPCDFGHFALVYAGSLYPPKRVLDPVFAALQRWKTHYSQPDRPWRFHYYGYEEPLVRQAASSFGLDAELICHGTVSQQEALAAVAGANVAVVVTSILESSSVEDRGIVPGKLYEAIGLHTPVLLVAPPGCDAEAVVVRSGGASRFSGSDVEGMAGFIGQLIHGHLPEVRDSEAFVWTGIGKHVDRLLRNILDPDRIQHNSKT